MNLPIIFVRFLMVVSIFGILWMDVIWKRGGYLILFVLMMDILYKRYYTKYPIKKKLAKMKASRRYKKGVVLK